MTPPRVTLISMVLIALVATVTCDCPAGGNMDSDDEEQNRAPPAQHVNIVLIGATGDLATRYLWPGLYNLFRRHYEEGKLHFSIYGCARKDADAGRKLISQIMLNTGHCTDEACRKIKAKFVSAVQYHSLASEKDYTALAQKVNENTQSLYGLLGTEFTTEEGRLVYLSIPPSAYAKTTALVHKLLRPKLGHPWFRIVLEKPFGHDLASAGELAEKIRKNFDESETYRIDHYLGKPVVKYILPFRQLNKEKYEPLWNHNHIERVEVVMKEKIDVKGRIDFFDKVGVIRDVMQNHLTEMMSLVAMELPHDPSNISLILQEKMRVLKQVVPPGKHSIVTGQYAAYVNESQSELKKPEYISKTLTFAATLLYVNNPRWQNVPFVLMSGKKLDVKSSFVRTVFKAGTFCAKETSENCDQKKQLLFLIGSGELKKPMMIALSNTLPLPKETPGWQLSELKLDTHIFGQSLNDTVQLMPMQAVDAYTTLIEAVYEGQRHLFTDTDSLMESWKIWTPLLDSLENKWPRIYDGLDADLHLLDVEISGKNLQFVHHQDEETLHVPLPGEQPVFQQSPTEFRSDKLVSGDLKDVIRQLADSIESLAKVNVQQQGSFHMALSGGTSPVRLLQHLVTASLTFPWERTHLWWVDERCVPLDDRDSNFNMVQTHLLQFINIPYVNIHPMPVHLSTNPCSDDLDTAGIYSDLLRRHVPDHKLDFVLLGIGKDGHTASLFPEQESLDATEFVTKATGVGAVKERMTLTFPLINNAKHIAVLAMGSDKYDILHSLADGQVDVQKFPITGVRPEDGELVWYADYEAVLEKQ